MYKQLTIYTKNQFEIIKYYVLKHHKIHYWGLDITAVDNNTLKISFIAVNTYLTLQLL